MAEKMIIVIKILRFYVRNVIQRKPGHGHMKNSEENIIMKPSIDQTLNDINTFRNELNSNKENRDKNNRLYSKYLTSDKNISFKKINENTVYDLIKEGEGEHVEFKSSLKWHIHKRCDDKKITQIILKQLLHL